MYCDCKGWIRQWIFRLSIFGSLLKHLEAEVTRKDIEQSLYDFAIAARKLSWKWKYPSDVCVLYRPDNYIVFETDLEVMPVRLESVACAKIDMEVLTCLYDRDMKAETDHENHEDDPTSYSLSKELFFTNGLNGEVYEMSTPFSNTRCSDPQSLVIQKCVNDGSGHAIDFTDIEESLLLNHLRVNAKSWRTVFTCKLACPKNFHFAGVASVEFVSLALESLDGRLIRVKALKCYFKNSRANTLQVIQFDGLWFHYTRDAYGEVYELFKSYEQTANNHTNVFVIQRRVIDWRGRLVQRSLCHETKPIRNSPLPPRYLANHGSDSLSTSACDGSSDSDIMDGVVSVQIVDTLVGDT